MEFEKKMIELEKILEKLENDDLEMDKGIELFERGAKLLKELSEMLKVGRQKAVKIKKVLDDCSEAPLNFDEEN